MELRCVGLVGLCFFGCAVASPVPVGSKAETQFHAPCPVDGSCADPLTCMGGGDSGQEATCELSCTGDCPSPLACMPRTDGQRGGVCAEPPEHSHRFGN